jgi:glyoxylase-like metal-dependent hydrolase (beta-lactamase superfamily II)/rhodanese-related sulfurtransferase
MYFQQFYLSCLSHASYMLGSEGIAAVVDPQRDIDIYLEEARKRGLHIEHVIETHLHADFVSGHRELAAFTGARIHVGEKAGAKFRHNAVRDGDQLSFGQCRLRFLETPGHTIESISVLVTDGERSREPFAVLTGDTLFIGDVGRPDLSAGHTPRELAAMLYDSLHHKLLKLPDSVEVYPAHGAGSLCGRQMSTERRSTIGEQRVRNYALQPGSKAEFVALVTAELPERPDYFAADVEINRSGAPGLYELLPVPGMKPLMAAARQTMGTVILDTRPAVQFGAAHVPGSIHIDLAGQFASWAATLLGLDQEIVLVAEDLERLKEARVRLARVGIEKVIGYVSDGIEGWIKAGLAVKETPQIPVQDLARLASEEPEKIQIVDVRRPAEWEEAHIPSARLKPLHKLSSMLEDLDPARLTLVHCKSGYRSSIATSLLERAGFKQIINVTGGFDAWRACNLPWVQGGRTVTA